MTLEGDVTLLRELFVPRCSYNSRDYINVSIYLYIHIHTNIHTYVCDYFEKYKINY